MNLRQLEYALALAEQLHFGRAAEISFVSQSTLSTMVSRLEEELGILLFDRSTKQISITKEGEVLLGRMRIVLKEVGMIFSLVEEMKGEIKGNLSIAAIPTVAPYLLPRFLWQFAKRYPKINIDVQELITENIIESLLQRKVDIGIIATPVENENIRAFELYEEPFLLYDCGLDSVRSIVGFDDINFKKMVLLEEGHCMSAQVNSICKMSNDFMNSTSNINFKAGSIDSLIRVTKINQGVTLLPKLSVVGFNKSEQKRLSTIRGKIASRKVRAVVHKHYLKQGLLNTFFAGYQRIYCPLFTMKLYPVNLMYLSTYLSN